MDATWRPLQVAGLGPTCPPLFAKSQMFSNSYVVFLTDLTHVWEETLDGRAICKRAQAKNTPIDPDEDAGQMVLLLEHIKSAIDGDKGTLRRLTRNATDPRALNLHLTTPLPASLGDLEWAVRLEPLPAVFLQQHLVSPLMSKVYGQMKQIDELVSQLNAKDHVISKLLDKLESSGMDITSVFPGAAAVRGSKHSMHRAQAARQVQGLGVFDYRQWQQRHGPIRNTKIPDQKMADVLNVPASLEHVEGVNDAAEYQWIAALPATVAEVKEPGNTGAVATTAAGSDTEDDVTVDRETSDVDEDIFERQDTPPRLKKPKPQQGSPEIKSPRRAPSDHDSDETTDEDDLDAPSSQPPRSQQATKDTARLSTPTQKEESTRITPGPRRLGKLGGKAPDPPTGQPSVNHPKVSESDATASETEDDDDLGKSKQPSATPPSPSATEQAKTAPIKKGKLGVLGGKKAVSGAPSSASAPPALEVSPASTPSRSRLRSKIGGKRDTESPANGQAASAVGRIGSPAAPQEQTSPVAKRGSAAAESTPPESEEQRANRKREELKRQLGKSQGPKKKRKF